MRLGALASFDSSVGKESTCSAGDPGLIPGSRRSTGEGIGYPLRYSRLENSMDCVVRGIEKSQTRLSDFHSLTHFYFLGVFIEIGNKILLCFFLIW